MPWRELILGEKMGKMKKRPCIGLIFIILLLLCGCGKTGHHFDADALNEPVFVSEFTNLAVDLSEAEILRMDSSAFYYVTLEWDSEQERTRASVYRTDLSDGRTTLQADCGSVELSARFLLSDQNLNIYLWGRHETENAYLAQKYDSDGILLWEAKADFSRVNGAREDYILGGVADGEGRLCLYDDLGNIYLFDKSGNLQKMVNPGRGTLSALLMTEEGILAACYQKWSGGEQGNGLEYILIDPETGDKGGEGRIALTGSRMPFVQGGSGNNLIYIDNGILWEWNLAAQEKSKLADLTDTYVSIDEAMVKAIGISDKRIEGVLLYDEWFGGSEYAAFTYMEKGLLPEKKTVTLGTTLDLNSEMLQQFVTRFNRQNKEWQVEIVEYFSYMNAYDNFLDEFTKDILDGNAPDLIDVRSVPVEMLTDKKFFEDLVPWFRQSAVVSKRDILDSVWEAGCSGREMQFVMPWFSLDSYVIKQDALSGDKWDLEEFVRLVDRKEGGSLFLYTADNTEGIQLEYALHAYMEKFCDIESEKCDFVNEEFIGLLEAIGRRGDRRQPTEGTADFEMWEQLVSGDIMLCRMMISEKTYYCRALQGLGDGCRWVGYPSGEKQHHSFSRFVLLGMNTHSEYKEGAWAFLEFLLSEEMQSWNSMEMNVFPVREDAFDRNISGAFYNSRGELVTMSGEEKESLRKLVDNAYLHTYRIYDPTYDIVWEECGAYFAGDRTARETAEIIQNRVQLYLDETD